MLSLFWTTFGMVFLTELVGDKTMITLGTLATRSRALPLLVGATVAFLLKTGAAVLFGQAIAALPAGWVAAMSAATFFAIAAAIALKRSGEPGTPPEMARHWSRTALAAFAALFFSEWGDLGQITTATLTARFQAPVVVWLGATLALVLKGSLVVAFGIGLRHKLPQRALRYGALAVCLVMGFLAAFRIPL